MIVRILIVWIVIMAAWLVAGSVFQALTDTILKVEIKSKKPLARHLAHAMRLAWGALYLSLTLWVLWMIR